MGIGYWNTLVTMQGAGPNLTGSLSATSILPQQAKIVLPNGFFAYVGQKFKVSAQGQLGNIVTTPGTLTMDMRMGTAGSIVVFNGGAMQLSATAHTTLPFWFDIEATLRANGGGTSANFMALMRFLSQCVTVTAGTSDPASGHSFLLAPNVTPVVGTGFDSTAANLVDIFGTFSLSNANAIQMQQYEIISPNWGG